LFDKKDEFQTEDGFSVTEYSIIDGEDDRYFTWEENGKIYNLSVSYNENDTITTEDIINIIDSAMGDERNFEEQDLMKVIQDKPALTDNEKKLNKALEKLKDND
jgi:hypothetical protein